MGEFFAPNIPARYRVTALMAVFSAGFAWSFHRNSQALTLARAALVPSIAPFVLANQRKNQL